MAGSTLDSDNFPTGGKREVAKGHDTRSLGPSDTSDSGSDMAGPGLDSDSDSAGTGEHMTSGKDPSIEEGGDIGTDRIVEAGEAGLGGGLDQAEEARLGITDEQIAQEARRSMRRKPGKSR